jgi:O-antigen ligase
VAITGPQVRRLLYAGAASGAVLLVVCVVSGQIEDGRFVIPDTTLYNPNDLAILLVLAGIFILILAFTKSAFLRIIPLLLLPVTVYFILKTASRANFLTILVLVGCALIVAPKKGKTALLILMPVVAAAMLILLPSSTWGRLTMIVLDPAEAIRENSEAQYAAGSQLARTELQKHGIELIGKHPVLGVGPGMFADAVDEMVRAETGMKSGWQSTHNVYLQIPAENGILAGLIFLGITIWTVAVNFKITRAVMANPGLEAYRGQSFCLLLLTLAFACGLLFGNYAYMPLSTILLGLTAANYMAVKNDPLSVKNDLQPVRA